MMHGYSTTNVVTVVSPTGGPVCRRCGYSTWNCWCPPARTTTYTLRNWRDEDEEEEPAPWWYLITSTYGQGPNPRRLDVPVPVHERPLVRAPPVGRCQPGSL